MVWATAPTKFSSSLFADPGRSMPGVLAAWLKKISAKTTICSRDRTFTIVSSSEPFLRPCFSPSTKATIDFSATASQASSLSREFAAYLPSESNAAIVSGAASSSLNGGGDFFKTAAKFLSKSCLSLSSASSPRPTKSSGRFTITPSRAWYT